eukprot:4263227-Pleurochrysis_carterae.AAC.1
MACEQLRWRSAGTLLCNFSPNKHASGEMKAAALSRCTHNVSFVKHECTTFDEVVSSLNMVHGSEALTYRRCALVHTFVRASVRLGVRVMRWNG